MRETSAEIDMAASEWAVRVRHAPPTKLEQAELDAWLEGDIRRVGAFARAQAVLIELRRVKALGLSINTSPADLASTLEADVAQEEMLEQPPARSFTRRALLAGGSAAAVAAGVIIGLPFDLFGEEAYATRRGEVRLVPLVDGSRMTMNTATKAKVHFSKEQRQIELADGEALFDVAKDPARPFLVVAGDTHVRAVGTSFTVRRIAGRPVQILVREGVVEISGTDGAAPRRISANMRVDVTDNTLGQAQEIDSAEIDRELVWREGMLSFEDQTLDHVAEEFARYSDVPIVFAERTIGQETITGVFAANDPRAFARAAALSLGLDVEASGDVIMLRAKGGSKIS